MKMNTPNKNRTAYYFFSNEKRKEIDIANKSEKNKIIRQLWKETEERTKWNKMAEEDKKRYDEEFEKWNKYKTEREVNEKMICKIKNIEFGLCCLNNTLKEGNIKVFPNRTCVLKTALNKGLEYVKSLVIQNLEDVLKMLDWNYEHGISSYRLSSNMFPHSTNDKFNGGYNLDFVDELLKKIGEKAKKYGIRLSMHPGHFNHIGAKTDKVFNNTLIDLKHHNDILDRIEGDIDFGSKRGILCLHGGGTYGDKEQTIKRWIENFKKIPLNIQQRICIENCEKSYSSEDCLFIANQLNIPHIFDIHHYNCYPLYNKKYSQKSISELLPSILETWNKRRLKPYFHISEQGEGPIGKHSEYIEELPSYLLDIKEEITLDIEAKGKEKAIFYLTKKYI